MYWLLYFVPKNYLSFCIGKLARVKLPGFLMVILLRWYCRRYGVNINEAERELAEYQSLQAFFIRNLRPGSRPIEEGLVSPVDGRIVEFGEIDNGKLIQVKGRDYRVSDLLCDEKLAARFSNGYYITIYLAPGDYHHIHSPASGKVTRAIYIPGKLWPVNNWSVKNINNLFAENERVVSVVERNGATFAVVKVGATNVGSITVEYSNLISNAHPTLGKGGKKIGNFEYPSPRSFERGERLGSFNLGSTVVLLIEKGVFKPGSLCRAGTVKVGQSLGALDF